MRQDRMTVLEKITELAIAESVQLVLIPGDLFEENYVTDDEIRSMRHYFEELQPVPVVIAPGNHDRYSKLSWYNRSWMDQKRVEPWPDNVYIFQSGRFESQRLPELDGVRVTGIAYMESRPIKNRMLESVVMKKKEDHEILLFHGSLERVGVRREKKTLPFSRSELQNQPCSYAAIGHYHEPRLIREEEADGSKILGAYAGAPMGVTLNDVGARHVLIGELGPDGVTSDGMEKRRVAPRLIHNVEIPYRANTGVTSFRNNLQEVLKESGATEEDVVRVRITGDRPGEDVLEKDSLQDVKNAYFHLEFDLKKTRPKLDIDELLEDESLRKTTEGQFVKKLRKRMEDAESDDRRHIAELALRLGVRAFRDKEIDLSREISTHQT